MTIQTLLEIVGSKIEDPDEEVFLLFSQSIPSQDLGFVDPKAASLDLAIGGRDLVIHQSPAILSSNRRGGTTGAVVWKITPLVAEWLSGTSNLLFKHGILDSQSTVIELGCGISGIIGITLGPLIDSYILTDQDYVLKLLNQNIVENQPGTSSASNNRKGVVKNKGSRSDDASNPGRVIATALDWEKDQVTTSLTGLGSKQSFDLVIACDCIYNDALITPLVETCVDACKLRQAKELDRPTVCLVAQQLRSAEVFEEWLKEFHRSFIAWRIPDDELIEGLRTDSGFVVHIGILRK